MAIIQASTTRANPGCLSLFALPFAAVGVCAAVFIGHLLWRAHQMAAWPEVPAIILSAESSPSSSHSGRSPTSQTRATYRYVVDGRTCTGHRVAIHDQGDNLGEFQARVYGELRQHQLSGEPFRCFVNPQDPGDSVLYRQVRWELLGFYLLFMLLFGGAGFGILIGAQVGRRRQQQARAAQSARPQEPWLWNPAWSGGVIRANERVAMWAILIFAVVWNLISSPIGWMALQDRHRQHMGAMLVALIFPAIGMGLAIWAARLVWRQVKYGTSVFRMSALPGVIGGSLRGMVEVPAHIQPADGFRVALRCVNRIVTGGSDNSSTREDVLWEDIRLQAHEVQDGNPAHALLPILFTVPRTGRPTDNCRSDNQIIWRLEVTAATDGGPRYCSSFDVPMFVTPDSVADVQPDAAAAERYGHSLRADEVLRDNGVRVAALPGGGRRYRFPAGRNAGSAISLTVFFTLWSGVLGFMIHQHLPFLFVALFGLFEAGLFIGVLSCWFDWRCIEIATDEVRISGGIFGLAGLRRLDRRAITAVEATSSSSQGNQQFFSLKVRTSGGAAHTAGKGIVGRAAAEVLAAELRRQLNLPEEKPG